MSGVDMGVTYHNTSLLIIRFHNERFDVDVVLRLLCVRFQDRQTAMSPGIRGRPRRLARIQ